MQGLLCNGCATRKNNFEKEDELRRRHTKKKFGVKVPRTNANKMKKTLEEDLIIGDEGPESDLEIIEYPVLTSNLSKMHERDTDDYSRTISPLSKMIKKVVVNSQIRKCDQFEQLNLSLEDNDNDDESAIINNNDCSAQANTILSNNLNLIDLGKDIQFSNSKAVYQKKVIANSVVKNANDDSNKNDMSISLFSHVSGQNRGDCIQNKKLFTQLKAKSHHEEEDQKEEKEEEQQEKDKHNDDLKLIESYQKFKQLEQLQQLKDLKKMKELIELTNTVNRLNELNKATGSLQPMFPFQQIPIGLPYQNSYMTESTMPTSPNHNQIQMTSGYAQPNNMTDYSDSNSKQSNVNAIEPHSCSYCEEIYQYTIMNNLPLKAIKCLYCGIVMNSKTLEYFLLKYKKDLELKYQSCIGKSKERIQEEGSNEEEQNDEDEVDEEEEERQRMQEEHRREKERERQRQKEKEASEESFPHMKQINKDFLPKPPRKNPKAPQRLNSEPLNNETRNKPASNIKLLNKTDLGVEKEGEEALINDSKANISLAEAFRSKRAKILTNIEKRSNSLKENNKSSATSTEPMEMRIIRERRNQRQKGSNTDTSTNLTAQEIKISQSLNVSHTSRLKSEPSPELMNRLIKGEKAKMSNKEMKDLNNRLYSKLVDVKAKKEDTNKKEELDRLNDAKKKYTNTLKNKVIRTYNNKKTQ